MHVETEYARVLTDAGVPIPRSGRPPKGACAASVLMHIRIPNKVHEILMRRAAKQGTSVARLIQMIVAKDALET